MPKPYDKETLSTIPSVIFGRFCAKIGVLPFQCEEKCEYNPPFPPSSLLFPNFARKDGPIPLME